MHDFRARIPMARRQDAFTSPATFLALLFPFLACVFLKKINHYSRVKDAKWYARQLQSLRRRSCQDRCGLSDRIWKHVNPPKGHKPMPFALDQEPGGK